MSNNLHQLYGKQFSTAVELLLQQRGSILRNCVTVGTGHKGEAVSPVDQIGMVEARKVTTRNNPIVHQNASVERRWVVPTHYDLAQLVSPLDELEIIADPKSKYVQNATFGMGRAMDRAIIEAALGVNKVGKEGGENKNFDPNQIIAADAVGDTQRLSLAKMIEAKKILRKNEAINDFEPIYMVATAEQEADLLQIVQVTSKDFNDKPVLVDGKVTRLLGVDIVYTELLPINENIRDLIMFTKSGLYLGLWQDTQVDVDKRKDLEGLPYQVYLNASFGSTRIEEKKIVNIKCSEA